MKYGDIFPLIAFHCACLPLVHASGHVSACVRVCALATGCESGCDEGVRAKEHACLRLYVSEQLREFLRAIVHLSERLGCVHCTIYRTHKPTHSSYCIGSYSTCSYRSNVNNIVTSAYRHLHGKKVDDNAAMWIA